MNINQIIIKKEKALKELQILESNTYTLFDQGKFIQDMKRAEYLRGQISLYESIIVDLQ